jgi:D-alanyl-D-alanine carboxypeptidase
MPNQETPNQTESSAHNVTRYAITLVCLLGAAAFFIVYGYMEAQVQPVVPQQAAAVVKANLFESVRIAAKSAVVIDLSTGETLFEKNADAQLPLASLTKVPLVAVITESMPASASVTIPLDTHWNSKAQQLRAGEVLKLQDLIDYTLIASSNEGAEILAAVAEKSVNDKYPQAPVGGATLWRMNNLVSELGLSHTYFLNPTGLDESLTQSGAYGSARDVAKIFAYAASTYPDTFAGTTQNGTLVYATDGSSASVTNTNEALGDIPGLMMGKTGFTDLAGGNLAVVFDVGLAHPVAAVVMGSTESARFSDMRILVKKAREQIMQK